MQIGVLGISFKSADLTLREKILSACQNALQKDLFQRSSFLPLSTCNRVEIYFSAEDLAEAHTQFLGAIRKEMEMPFEHKLYSYFGEECFAHLTKVASGLDSLIVQECEIQRQVKEAYSYRMLSHKLPSSLHYLFQKSLQMAKKVRTSFPLQTMRLEEEVFSLGKNLFKKIEDSSCLFVGNSEINRKILRFFKKKGLERITLCTRSLSSAKELQEELQIGLIDWSSLSTWGSYDFVIAATNYQNLLSLDNLQEKKVALIIDLSVPRSVDPKIGKDPHIVLIDMEEMGKRLDKKKDIALSHLKNIEEWIRKASRAHAFLFVEKQKKSLENV